MNLRFDAIGLTFEAEVDYSPSEPATWDYPGCDESLEFNELYVVEWDARSEAFFLLDSTAEEEISDAAWKALRGSQAADEEDAAIAAYENAMECRRAYA
jgi:hypothetical protein